MVTYMSPVALIFSVGNSEIAYGFMMLLKYLRSIHYNVAIGILSSSDIRLIGSVGLGL